MKSGKHITYVRGHTFTSNTSQEKGFLKLMKRKMMYESVTFLTLELNCNGLSQLLLNAVIGKLMLHSLFFFPSDFIFSV